MVSAGHGVCLSLVFLLACAARALRVVDGVGGERSDMYISK